MCIKVHVEYGKSKMDLILSAGDTPLRVLKDLDLYPDAHLILRGKMPIPVDEELREGDTIKIIKIASGG